MEVFKLKKKRLHDFLNRLSQSYELIAPVKTDVVRFEIIKDASSIYLGKNSYFPLKEYFFKKQEVLFRFIGTRITVPVMESKKRIFFGIRRCDLNAIMHQDVAFGKNDPYYSASRGNSFLIGYHCNEAPSPFCFCGSMELKDFFDLMFYEKKEYFLVEVGSEQGKFLLSKFRNFFEACGYIVTEEDKYIPGAERLEKKDISNLYEHPDWKKGVGLCLSCAACTSLCPTCYCFEIYDEVTAKNPDKGERKRKWSSCQLQEFTEAAGSHVFREEREERFKHRIYHQLEYFRQKNGINLCVGCGRCIEGCPTRIDFVRILNEMK